MGSWLVAITAAADGRVVVLDFDGPQSARLRGEVVSALSAQDVDFAPKAEVERAARRLDADLSSADGRVAVARELEIGAFVEGETEKSGSRVSLTVRVYSGHNGRELGDAEFNGRRARVQRRVKRNGWDQLGPLIARGEVPEPEPEPIAEDEPEDEAEDDDTLARDEEDEEDEDEEDEEDEDGDAPQLHALDLAVGMRFVSRDFGYKDPILALADYSLPPNPALYLHAHWYPAAHFTNGVLAHFGLDLAYTLLIGPSSERDGQSFDTSGSSYRFGLRARLPLGNHELGLSVGYAALSFGIEDAADGTPSGVPDVSYGFLRVGPDLRIGIGSTFAIEAEVAYLQGLKYGNIKSENWFPNTSGNGIDVGLRVAWAPLAVFELFGGATYRQIGLAFDPQPEDDGAQQGRVAGGAADTYLSPELGVRLRI